MKWLHSTYTQRFNRRHHECGHLLQGRYKALLIDPDDETYFKVISNYIHLNPARAKKIQLREGLLKNYPWSSFPGYISPKKCPPWLCVERVLDCWRFQDNRSGRLQYHRFIQGLVDDMVHHRKPGDFDPQWSKIRRGWFWGSKQFGQLLLDKLDDLRSTTKPDSLAGPEIRLHNERQAEQLKQQGLQVMGLTEDDLLKLPKGAAEKRVLAWFIKHQTMVSNSWISEQLHGGHPANVPGYVKSVIKSKDRKIRRMCKDLKASVLDT